MKKLILLSLFLLVGFLGQSQTVIITPTIGASSQSLQAIGDNTLTRIYVAETTTPGIYVRITSGTVSIIGGTIAINGGTLNAVNNVTISNTPTVVISSGTTSIANSTLTSSPSSVTTSGTVTAGAKAILFETSSDFVGTIDGELFQANGFLSLPISPGTSWPAIPYTVTAGTLYIRKFN